MSHSLATGSQGKMASGSWSGSCSEGKDLPLVDCPYCRIPVIKLQSKQPATYGKDDPMSCPFYKWEKNYKSYLWRQGLEQQQGGDAVGGEIDLRQQIIALREQNFKLKQEMGALKQEVATTNSMVMKGSRGLIVDSVCVVTCCVGCVLGIVIAIPYKM